jgi:hypothetical protein
MSRRVPRWRHRCHRPQTAGVLLLALAACSGGSPRPGPDEALADTLRNRIREAYDFSRPDIADRMAGLYRRSGSVVSASGGRIVSEPDSLRAGIRAFWENTGRNMRNPAWRWGEVHVERLARDAAVLTATWSIPHVAPTGRPHVLEGAWTAVFRHTDGRWYIVAEHLSAP